MADVPESSLEAGLAALEQGDFNRAIALLEAVRQNSSQPTATQVLAQKGLVTAYVGNEEDNKAIYLLKILSQSSDLQVSKWATLNYPQLVSAPIDATGFVAFEEVPEKIVKAIISIEEAVIESQQPESIEKAVIESQQTKSIEEKVLTPTAFTWQHTLRAQRSQPLKEVNLFPLWLLMVGSAIALFWLLRQVSIIVMLFINDLLVKLPYLEPFQPFYHDPSNLILLLLLALTISSPWLLDGLLHLSYNIQPLSINQLAKHSPESARLLQRFCRQQGWDLPQLAIVPTSAPCAFTYGNLRRTARIAISQGLLEQLAEDEIASIYASQLGHIASYDFTLMSLFMVLTQGIYAIYCYLATWGDRQINSKIKIVAVTISSAAYGLWWLLCLPALGLSQVRIYYSDRFASNITGNPNSLTRALIKSAIAIAKDVQQKECTSFLLESLNLFVPVNFYQAITLGSFYPEIEPILAWDCLNPYRYLLSINNTHPLMGDRLQRLNALAEYWHLETELKLPPTPKLAIDLQSWLRSRLLTSRALLQFIAVFGLISGLVFGALTWLIGAIALVIWIPWLAWMYGDWLLIKAFIPIALSISLFLRINFLFPNITPAAISSTPSLAKQLANFKALPIDSNPVRLKGKLLGRRGIANWLGQDLLLNSSQGLVKLHYQSALGTIGNIFLRQSLNPTDLLGRHIVVTGWFRRGANIWIDLNTLQTQTGKVSHSYQPLWATIMALAIALYGSAAIVLGR